ncbi:MAG TPA: MBL fold metallo-hydrolase [bacterium]|nr:MBL fold metallo-hydrolase [bacterium]HPQ66320.1 MBL fold metallo-hydrolase [bacterium]
MPEFRKLAKNVYAFVQPPLIWHSTAGVILRDRDVVVVDSLANEAMTRALLGEIRKITDNPVRFLINTHSHADHVYTNHLFPSATVVCSRRGWEKTREFQRRQALHTESFARLFPDMDFSGGRYTLQDAAFTGVLSLYRNEREIRLIELGPGHSESDVAVHLPAEGIVFCGDLFMNGLPPLPGEGLLTATVANLKKLLDLGAETYVAGHGSPGTMKDAAEHLALLEALADKSRRCFDRGLSYDEAMEALSDDPLPAEFIRPTLLSGYREWAGKMPACGDPADTDHMRILSRVARRAELLLRPTGG